MRAAIEADRGRLEEPISQKYKLMGVELWDGGKYIKREVIFGIKSMMKK